MDEITWRPVEGDDVPAWAALFAAAEEIDRTGDHYSEPDLREELDDPDTDPPDRLSGWIGGRMVAYAGVLSRGAIGDHHRIDAEGVVHPDHRGLGLGTRLVAWVLERADEIHARRSPQVEARIGVGVYLDNSGAVSLLEDRGFRPVNWSALMRVQLTGLAIPPAAWPGRVAVHAYDAGWAPATREAHNSAFADHWGFVDWTPHMWQQHVDGSRNFRPDLSWVLVDDRDPEVVVGHIQTNEYDAYEEATGRKEAFVANIGIRREHRERGLASNLLRHALRAYQAAGFDESALGVDTNNATGAFGLYERAGYQVERRVATFRRELPPLEPLSSGPA